jgi:GTP-binding protein
MFIDKTVVRIKAGDGGKGIVSFRRERYVEFGGPDGGDGGRGGNIVLIASRNQNTLAAFRFQKELAADDGGKGDSSNKHGRNGKDLLVQVPVGTMVLDSTGKVLLADMSVDGQEVIIARGGKGGFGNAHFTSSVRQAPKFAEKGEPGEVFEAILELKMIADVGLVGLPNAGKSTFLASLSNARPEIADYPFTTLIPNLGIVPVDKQDSLLFADIPGLIEGASEGKGLGDEFLRHVERTKVLIHLVDAWSDDVVASYKTIMAELAAYKIDLSKKAQIVALSKIDGLDDDIVADQLAQIKKVAPKGTLIFAISAPSRTGTKELLYAVLKLVRTAKAEVQDIEDNSIPIIGIKEDDKAWHITKENDEFYVRGRKIERFAVRADVDSEEGERRIRDIMRKMGIMAQLERQGILPEQKIHIGEVCTIEY